MKFIKKLLGSPVVNRHIAEITGQKTHTRPYVWSATKAFKKNEEYSHITGGMVLPTFDKPGFLLTIGVHPETNAFYVIDEFESDDSYAIIRKAQEIQEYYGKGVIQNWWGNPETLMSIVNEVNIKGNPVLISQPIDHDRVDSFPLYTTRLKTALSASYKTLYLGEANRLRNHILAFVQDKTAKAVDNPAVAITGALVHTLLIMRPWEQSVEKTELVPTSFEDFAAYESKKAMEVLEQELYA